MSKVETDDEKEADGYVEALRKVYAEGLPMSDWYKVLQKAFRSVPSNVPFVLESERKGPLGELNVTLSARAHEAIQRALKDLAKAIKDEIKSK